MSRSPAAGTDGKVIGEVPLDAPTVRDDLAAAHGRLYVATTTGRFYCLGAK